MRMKWLFLAGTIAFLMLSSCNNEPEKEMSKKDLLSSKSWKFESLKVLTKHDLSDSIGNNFYQKYRNAVTRLNSIGIIQYVAQPLTDTIFWRLRGDTIILIGDSMSDYPKYSKLVITKITENELRVVERIWLKDTLDSFFYVDIESKLVPWDGK